VQPLLAVSRVIDAVTGFIGHHIRWLILAAVLVSAVNAIIRKLFDISSNAWLELQWYLFGAAIKGNYVWLAVLAVVNSAISLYYYIRIVVFMYLKKETIGSQPTTSPALAVVLGVAVAGTLVIGVYPRLLFEVAELSARTLGAAAVAAALR